jgi:hypothetical protein
MVNCLFLKISSISIYLLEVIMGNWTKVDSSSVSKIRVAGNDLDLEFLATGAIYRWENAACEYEELISMSANGKSIGSYVNVVMKNRYSKPRLLDSTEYE